MNTLNAKENLLRVLRHQQAQYVPFGIESAIRLNHRDSLFYNGNGNPEAVHWVDPWGVRFAYSDPINKFAYPISHPLRNIEDLESIPWPDPREIDLFETAKATAANVDRREHILVAENPGFMFVRSWLIFGMTGSGLLSLPKFAIRSSTLARRFSLELKS